MNSKSFSQYTPGIVALLVLFVGFLVVNAFTSPTQAPPGGNVPAPLNIGSASQTKAGNLALNTSNLFANGLLIPFGNVGIGTASPGTRLTIRNSVAGNTFAIRNTADTADTFTISDTGTVTLGFVPWPRLTTFPAACPAGQFVTAVGGVLTCATPAGGGITGGGLWVASGTNIFNTNTGNVGIGDSATNPSAQVHIIQYDAADAFKVVDAISSTLLVSPGTPAEYGAYGNLISPGVAAVYQTVAYDTSPFVIDQNGNVGIGMASPGYKLEVVGTAAADAFIYRSDVSLKQNIQELNSDEALENILKLQGVSFTYKDNDKKSIGLIAQEVEKIFPELIYTNSENGLKGIDYVRLAPLLIEAIKSQQSEIENLKALLDDHAKR